MAEIKRRKYVLKSQFHGMPKRENLEIVEETLPPLQDGEFLCEAEWLSVDPYMRAYPQENGDTMIGSQVAKVTETKNKDFAVGDFVVGRLGWVDRAVGNSSTCYKLDASVPPEKNSFGLGVLGMPGATAYFGFLELCKPKAGETLVVNAAAGAVGSIVGQIAKIKGCRVVGFAGTDAKVEYLKSLNFDAAYNYKTMSSLNDALKESCPGGVDVFFDNVGGEFFSTVVSKMNEHGRISCCGAISEYNLTEPTLVRPSSRYFVFKQLKVEGFIVTRWLKQWPEAFKEIAMWMKEGKLKYEETVTDGFENMFDAFHGLFTGSNLGKAVVKA